LASEVGGSEDETFWAAFLRWLLERGLAGVQLVASSCQKPVHPLLVHQPAFPPH
jgi:transposase-like protein